jgi:hypothetical protein
MLVRPLLACILDDDALTRELCDPEARILIEWLVDQAEHLARGQNPEGVVRLDVMRLCRRARAISRFVALWCHRREPAAAIQLAAAERCVWPLPTRRRIDPCELMHTILQYEASSVAA